MNTTHTIRHATHGARVLSLLFAMLAACVLAPNAALAQSVEWSQRVVSGPSARVQHAMAYDAARGITVLFGGNNRTGHNAETWEWNGTAWTQRVVSGPSARSSHAMAYDAARGVTVLFGGSDAIARNAETWEWNGTAWTQRVVSGPSARVEHAMVHDAARGVTVLFGVNADGIGETWEWNGTAWTQRVVSGPSQRMAPAMAYDAARGVTVLFGGYDGSGMIAETWEWNGTAWTQRAVSGPSARAYSPMAYDAARGVTVLFGGYPGSHPSYRSDTWEWNGTAWTQRVVSGPTARFAHAMAYDAARGVTVLFGGLTSGIIYNAESWELGLPCPSITAQPLPRYVCPSGSTNFTVAATVVGGGALTYGWQWQFEGDTQWVPIVAGLNSFAGVPQFDATGTTTTRVSLRPPVGPGGVRQWPNPGYRVRAVVSNDCEPVVSDSASLTVCAADFNCDGFLDFFDYDEFVTAFETGGGLEADFNRDGFVDFFDYDDFVLAFETGC